MPLAKTDKARDALRRRDAALRPGDRPLLILCDGVRGDAALCALLGPDTAAALERLAGEGYLALAAEATPPAVLAAPGVTLPLAVVPSASAGARRSLAAAKVYTVGMLQLIRDAEAVEQVSAIQTCGEEAALVHHLFEALRYLGRKAPATYGRRVAERLLEILPEAHLPALRAVADEVFEPAEQTAQA